jgi:uncharacterized protein
MAVETIYRSTFKSGVVFLNRAEADAYDRVLETAENLSSLIRHVLPNVSEDDAEKLGIFMAERRDSLAVALKKNPSGITELLKADVSALAPVVQLANAS